MASLTLSNIHKTFPNGVEVLKGIDIGIDDGQFLILVGGSGCGKSTLLNIVAGLEHATSGEVRIGGRVVNALSPKDRDIAMVFQSYALYPSMSVRDNIAFGLQIRKVAKAEQEKIIARVAETLQIGHLLDRKPRQLSGGQRQRVAMARALAREPSLFLFDEPLSNLDAKLRVEVRSEIKLMHHRLGATIVYVTHDQIEAMTLGDRIAVMKDGVVQQFGDPQEIYDRPANLFVAGFIGSPSMNFLRGKLATNGSGLHFESVCAGQRHPLPLPSAPPAARALIGREVILGLRPERISNPNGHAHNLVIDCPIDLVEPTGPDTLVFTQLNGTKVGCRVDPRAAVTPGRMMPLAFDMSQAVLFDPETERRIG
ncbi:MAG TPA: sn-glycerol-3-phosphate ABC transporter ATP-binding protein UgpC [Burkholderiaceae bacterium]|nr:sn-glycerol-3-phosphate ABC transporter ATP-binding protein UgpC [Burkholderiaceae bacterium]